jgi:hypothetical protein
MMSDCGRRWRCAIVWVMRIPPMVKTQSMAVALVLGALVSGCSRTAGLAPTVAAGFDTANAGEATGSSAGAPADGVCTLALHAVLRESGPAAVGQIQLRIEPTPDGSGALVTYHGVVQPSTTDYSLLRVSVLPRLPGDQGPTWTDVGKHDPGTTIGDLVRFGNEAISSPALALALVDDASRFKAVVNVESTSGGTEAEGLVAPDRHVPETLRERQRLCFNAG